MKRFQRPQRLRLAALLGALAATTLASSGATAQTSPAASPPTGAQAQNPHAVAQNPHLIGAGAGRPTPSSTPDPSLPPGVLVVRVVDASGNPVSGVEVKALETLQSVSSGNSDKRLSRATNADGLAEFPGLDTSLKNSVTVSLSYDGADYQVPPFRSQEKSGHRITLPVFKKTADPVEARVGMRGFVYVMIHEGEFVFDVLFRVFTLGERTWAPQGIRLRLPERADAIQPTEDMAGFEPDGVAVRMNGSYPPGQKDLRFTFRIPSINSANESFRIELPPHVAELRVLVDQVPGLELRIPGFEPIQEADGPEGNRVLISRRLTPAGGVAPTEVTVDLLGLPTVGPERWYAVGLAALFALAGGAAAWRNRRRGETEEELRDQARARELLLDDLLLLEKSHKDGEVGPETYEQARRQLMHALARLEQAPS